jgi:hypothetical protein
MLDGQTHSKIPWFQRKGTPFNSWMGGTAELAWLQIDRPADTTHSRTPWPQTDRPVDTTYSWTDALWSQTDRPVDTTYSWTPWSRSRRRIFLSSNWPKGEMRARTHSSAPVPTAAMSTSTHSSQVKGFRKLSVSLPVAGSLLTCSGGARRTLGEMRTPVHGCQMGTQASCSA